MIKTTEREAIVPTKVRVENIRAASAYLGTVKWDFLGKIELRYPTLPQSGAMTLACACCGQGADAVTPIHQFMDWSGQSLKSTHLVPSCLRCKKHQEAESHASSDVGCLVLIFGLVMIFFIGENADSRLAMLCGALILIAGEIPLLFWFNKRTTQNEKELEPLMGEKCTGLKFCSFKRETKGFIDRVPIDVFLFTNRDYALRFADLNGGKVE
jgi:hypothetical protein